MGFLGGGPSIIIYHVAPSFVAAFLYFLLAQLFIFIFRIKKPSAKFILYFLVLYKSLLLLIKGAYYSTDLIIKKPFNFGATLVDPLDLIPFSNISTVQEVSIKFLQSALIIKVITIVLIILVALLALRLIAIVWFLNKIHRKGKIANASTLN
ncbi:MAG: hypothetical protein E3J54_03780, partial [Actinobacteria bacterium]